MIQWGTCRAYRLRRLPLRQYHDYAQPSPHPGEIIKALCLEPLGLSITEAAEQCRSTNASFAGCASDAGEWSWSGYLAMIGQAEVPKWLETDWLAGLFWKAAKEGHWQIRRLRAGRGRIAAAMGKPEAPNVSRRR